MRASMIAFVEAKRPDYGRVRELLSSSEASGTWSNFGPVSTQLEDTAAAILDLPADRRVVACASGAVALHCLVHLFEHLAGRPLRWVVSAFTFWAQRQGPLAEALALDCDDHGMLDLTALAALPPDSYDGIVVTNMFGTALDAERYEALAARLGKVLLFDSATCFGSDRDGKSFGRLGSAELFSFHHTKPCGFGEGGCVVVPAELADPFRSLINFGLYKGIDTGARSCNGKMSDVAAAFILDRLASLAEIRASQREQFRRLAGLARAQDLGVLVDGTAEEGALPTLAPILFPRPVAVERLAGSPVVLHKYYRPVASQPCADRLYARIVCFPCHADVARLSDDALASTMASLR